MRAFRLVKLESVSDAVDHTVGDSGRVAAFEPHIHALYLIAPERALAEARVSEARWARGEPSSSMARTGSTN